MKGSITMNYTITAINKETRDQHWTITLCPSCRKHFILESVYDCAPFDIPYICTRTGISNYNPNNPAFTYDFDSDDSPF